MMAMSCIANIGGSTGLDLLCSGPSTCKPEIEEAALHVQVREQHDAWRAGWRCNCACELLQQHCRGSYAWRERDGIGRLYHLACLDGRALCRSGSIVRCWTVPAVPAREQTVQRGGTSGQEPFATARDCGAYRGHLCWHDGVAVWSPIRCW